MCRKFIESFHLKRDFVWGPATLTTCGTRERAKNQVTARILFIVIPRGGRQVHHLRTCDSFQFTFYTHTFRTVCASRGKHQQTDHFPNCDRGEYSFSKINMHTSSSPSVRLLLIRSCPSIITLSQ